MLAMLRKLDAYSFEMIVAAAIVTLYDFLLSDAMSLPLALQHSQVGQLRALDKVASGLEYLVPIVVFATILVLWLISRNEWVRHIVVAYLVWVTLRLVGKVGLVMYIVISRPQKVVGVLLTDTVVLWFVNVVLFSIWYWIIDGGGPRARRDGTAKRFDFAFPQRAEALPDWDNWKPSFWDYLFLGFTGSTQFGQGDTDVLSLRAKFLLMVQVVLSFTVIVFIASVAIGLIR